MLVECAAPTICRVLLVLCVLVAQISGKPNIIVIIADDLGWNDVSFHGSAQIMTPNIDALAFKGLVLNRHYTQPTCSPSRAALLTGHYPVHTGVQMPFGASSASALPLNHTLLPEYLGRLGYQTHLVGKWHLGYHRPEFLPTHRGFQSHFGFWNGFVGYHDGLHVDQHMVGIDARRNEAGAWAEFIGQYATDVFTKEAVTVVNNHDGAQGPLYLQLALSAPHAGNPGMEFEVRDLTANEELNGHIADIRRRLYAGMVQGVDDAVGAILEALNSRSLLNNSIVLFTSDNGGPTLDPVWGYDNTGSNWPLRGMKVSCHEGGVRTAAALWSPLLPGGDVSEQLIHITDWLPTLYSAAGGDVKDLGMIDGVDQWASLLQNKWPGPRSEMLVELNPLIGNEALIAWPWKLVKSTNKTAALNVYAGDSGRGPEVPEYNTSMVADSRAARAVKLGLDVDLVALRTQASLDGSCLPPSTNTTAQCDLHYCLFNLEVDPCETTDLSTSKPALVASLRGFLGQYRESLATPQTYVMDSRANPAFWNQYWSPWAEGDSATPSSACSAALPTVWILLLLRLVYIKTT